MIEEGTKVPVKEEVAKAILKYVFKDENAFYKLKERMKTKYSELKTDENNGEGYDC